MMKNVRMSRRSHPTGMDGGHGLTEGDKSGLRGTAHRDGSVLRDVPTPTLLYERSVYPDGAVELSGTPSGRVEEPTQAPRKTRPFASTETPTWTPPPPAAEIPMNGGVEGKKMKAKSSPRVRVA